MIAYAVIGALFFITLGVLSHPRVIKDEKTRMYVCAYTLMGGIVVWAFSAIAYVIVWRMQHPTIVLYL